GWRRGNSAVGPDAGTEAAGLTDLSQRRRGTGQDVEHQRAVAEIGAAWNVRPTARDATSEDCAMEHVGEAEALEEIQVAKGGIDAHSCPPARIADLTSV